MLVTKRNGVLEAVKFDKITDRISKLTNLDERKYIDPLLIAQKVVGSIFDKITTEEIDLESANICVNLSTINYLYSELAGRLLISNLHKKTNNSFVEKQNIIQRELNILDVEWLEWINDNKTKLNKMIDYNRDFLFDFFGYKTLERSYLLSVKDKIIERPQDMLMRIASFIHKGDLESIKTTYDLMSKGYYTHASPTLFNSGNKKSQLASCFLIGTEDSIEGITHTWSSVAKISKWGGGIGLHVSNIRAKDTLIRGTNGPSNGIIPMLKVFNEIARYVNQCFIGTTKIYTNQGLKEIKNISPNDSVYTIDGTLKKVQRVYCDIYDSKILKLKINGCNEINVTLEHPFYILKNQAYNSNEDRDLIIKRLDNKYIHFEWIDANKIEDNDLIVISIPTDYEDIIDCDDSDCYFYAFLLYLGEISDNIIIFKIENKKIDIINFIKGYLDLKLITYKIDNNTDNIIFISFNLSSSLRFSRSQFYDGKKKTIDKSILNLPKNKIGWIIQGFMDCNNGIIKVNENIADGIIFMYLKLGKLATKKYMYESFYVDIIVDNNFLYNNYILTKFVSSKENSFNGLVYDLEMTENHNYLTEAGLVHNGGKRKGSIAIYLEPHHPDIMPFLELRKNFGAETERARDLFLAVWVSDLFMKQVDIDGDWYLMCPDLCPNLNEVYGEEYETLYWKYVEEKKYKSKIKARDIMKNILDSQLETGTPYITFKDHANNKSNQKNIGTIKSSNLCVHEDTMILTKQGYKNIKSLENLDTIIWNGSNWSSVVVKQTGTNQNLIRISLSNGAFLDCTREHIFYIQTKLGIVPVEAQHLRLDDILIKINIPSSLEFNYNITNDFKVDCGIPFSSNINEKLRWLENYCEIYGTIYNLSDGTNELHIDNADKEFLLDIRMMLHTLDLESTVINNNISYSLIINNINKLIEIGFKPNCIIIPKDGKLELIDVDIKIINVSESFQNVDTYCFTEPISNMGVFNGILTGQCNEILEFSNHEEYAVCNLASIAINKCVEKFVGDKEFTIYTKENCKYCTFSKTYLLTSNFKFTEIEIEPNELEKLFNSRSYPQILYDNEIIGGWDDFYRFIVGTFNYDTLYSIAYKAAINLDKTIDLNYYPVPEAKRSNMRHRPIGLGIQGLADTLVLLKIPFDSDEALDFNKKFMEIIYLAACTASKDVSKSRYIGMKRLQEEFTTLGETLESDRIVTIKKSLPEYYDPSFRLTNKELNKLYHSLKPCHWELKKHIETWCGAYSTFEGSPISQGIFQFDMWNQKPEHVSKWEELRNEIKIYGIRNSLLTALMPTASTSQILGNNECFEFFTNNIYTRRTLAGDFPLVNKYLIDDLIKIGLWNDEMKQLILANNGSIAMFSNIPEQIRRLYQTIWEIKQVWVLKAAVARGPFVDQTQSMNIFMAVPDYNKLYSSHMWSWKNGLKTGIYYLRSRPSKEATKVTIDETIQNKLEAILNNEDQCIHCSG